MANKEDLLQILRTYKELGIAEQLNYEKFNLTSLVTCSTAMEGSTLTEIDNQLLFGEHIIPKDKSDEELSMNLDLKAAYDIAIPEAVAHTDWSVERFNKLASMVMSHTGKIYECAHGSFDTSKGEWRLLNATAGAGGSSYLDYLSIPSSMQSLCQHLNSNRRSLLLNRNIYDMYMLSFDAYYILATIHPWGDGNGRMCRLVMNALQYEFSLVPSRVMKENKAGCIQAWLDARELDSSLPFSSFLLNEHIHNVTNEVNNYKKYSTLNPIEPQREPHEGPQHEPHGKNNEPQRKSNEPHEGPQSGFRGPQIFLHNEPQHESFENEIFEAIRNDRKITREELAELTGTSLSTVKRRLKNMSHLVEFVGSGYSGYWRVKEKDGIDKASE